MPALGEEAVRVVEGGVDAYGVAAAFAQCIDPLEGAERPAAVRLADFGAAEADGEVAARTGRGRVAPGFGDPVGGHEVVGGKAGGGGAEGGVGVDDGRVGDGHQVGGVGEGQRGQAGEAEDEQVAHGSGGAGWNEKAGARRPLGGVDGRGPQISDS